MLAIDQDKLLADLASDLGIHYETLRQYWRVGKRSESGKMVKLVTVKLPSGRGSSMQRYREFCDALNDK